MPALYPKIESFKISRLKVSALHNLYVEQSGTDDGDPVVVLHGGPGSGSSPKYRQNFDPKHYRIIQFDQRGSGKSNPTADLRENTTWHYVDDIERLRTELDVDRWHVAGGSWGVTLALAYAITHPERVKSLCLRGVFLCRPKELRWLYQEGASHIWPDLWASFRDHIPEAERNDFIAAYHTRLMSEDRNVQIAAAVQWSLWEGSTAKLVPSNEGNHEFGDPDFALSFAKIENHFFSNRGFFESNNWIIENLDPIRHIPCEMVHGRYDIVCPLEGAWELHKAWPESRLHIVPDAGHSSSEPGIAAKLTEITDRFRKL